MPKVQLPDGLKVCSFYDSSESNDFYKMANYSKDPVKIDGVDWPTSEHYFQAQKIEDPAKKEQFIKDMQKPENQGGNWARTHVKDYLPEIDDPKNVGKKIPKVPDGWHDDGGKAEKAMLKALKAKYEQNPGVKEVVDGTGNMPIVEDTAGADYKDDTWGCGWDGKGENKLGMLWMQVRAEKRDGKNEVEAREEAGKLRDQAKESLSKMPSRKPEGKIEKGNHGKLLQNTDGVIKLAEVSQKMIEKMEAPLEKTPSTNQKIKGKTTNFLKDIKKAFAEKDPVKREEALKQAADKAGFKSFEDALKNGVDKNGQSVLVRAIKSQDFSLTKHLLDANAPIRAPEREMFALAIDSKKGQESAFKNKDVQKANLSKTPDGKPLHELKEYGLVLGVKMTAKGGKPSSMTAHTGPSYQMMTDAIGDYAKKHGSEPGKGGFKQIAEGFDASNKAGSFKFSKAEDGAGDKIAQRIKAGQGEAGHVTTIPTSFKGHAMGMSVVSKGPPDGGGYLVVTNRGTGARVDGGKPGTQIYELDKDQIAKIDGKFCQKMMNGHHDGATHQQIKDGIKGITGDKEPTVKIDQSGQKNDNCTVANTRSNVEGILLCQKAITDKTPLDKLSKEQKEASEKDYKTFTKEMREDKVKKLADKLSRTGDPDLRTFAEEYMKKPEKPGDGKKELKAILQQALNREPNPEAYKAATQGMKDLASENVKKADEQLQKLEGDLLKATTDKEKDQIDLEKKGKINDQAQKDAESLKKVVESNPNPTEMEKKQLVDLQAKAKETQKEVDDLKAKMPGHDKAISDLKGKVDAVKSQKATAETLQKNVDKDPQSVQPGQMHFLDDTQRKQFKDHQDTAAKTKPFEPDKKDADLKDANKKADDKKAEDLKKPGKYDPGHKAQYWKDANKNMRKRANKAYKDLAMNPPSATGPNGSAKDPNELLGELIAWLLMMIFGGIGMGIGRAVGEAITKGMEKTREHGYTKVANNLGEMKDLVDKRNLLKEGGWQKVPLKKVRGLDQYERDLAKAEAKGEAPSKIQKIKDKIKERKDKIAEMDQALDKYKNHIVDMTSKKADRDAKYESKYEGRIKDLEGKKATEEKIAKQAADYKGKIDEKIHKVDGLLETNQKALDENRTKQKELEMSKPKEPKEPKQGDFGGDDKKYKEAMEQHEKDMDKYKKDKDKHDENMDGLKKDEKSLVDKRKELEGSRDVLKDQSKQAEKMEKDAQAKIKEYDFKIEFQQGLKKNLEEQQDKRQEQMQKMEALHKEGTRDRPDGVSITGGQPVDKPDGSKSVLTTKQSVTPELEPDEGQKGSGLDEVTPEPTKTGTDKTQDDLQIKKATLDKPEDKPEDKPKEPTLSATTTTDIPKPQAKDASVSAQQPTDGAKAPTDGAKSPTLKADDGPSAVEIASKAIDTIQDVVKLAQNLTNPGAVIGALKEAVDLVKDGPQQDGKPGDKLQDAADQKLQKVKDKGGDKDDKDDPDALIAKLFQALADIAKLGAGPGMTLAMSAFSGLQNDLQQDDKAKMGKSGGKDEALDKEEQDSEKSQKKEGKKEEDEEKSDIQKLLEALIKLFKGPEKDDTLKQGQSTPDEMDQNTLGSSDQVQPQDGATQQNIGSSLGSSSQSSVPSSQPSSPSMSAGAGGAGGAPSMQTPSPTSGGPQPNMDGDGSSKDLDVTPKDKGDGAQKDDSQDATLDVVKKIGEVINQLTDMISQVQGAIKMNSPSPSSSGGSSPQSASPSGPSGMSSGSPTDGMSDGVKDVDTTADDALNVGSKSVTYNNDRQMTDVTSTSIRSTLNAASSATPSPDEAQKKMSSGPSGP